MTDVQRVSRPGSPFSGGERAVALVVTIGILAAIAKPWGDDAGGDRPGAVPLPSISAASPPRVVLPGHAYDPKMFGPFEPAPDWSMWPAGYFVSVQYVTRQANGRPPDAPPDRSSAAPGSSPTPSPTPDPSVAVVGPDWPAEVVVGPGDHLLWLGVNTPLGWTIRSTVLNRVASDGSLRDMPITRLPSEWDDHFAVLGIPVGASSDRLTDWPPGAYRLDITVDPGGVTRSIRVTIMTTPAPVPEPGATSP